MSYNWKCCIFYPNNFDASALLPKYAKYIGQYWANKHLRREIKDADNEAFL